MVSLPDRSETRRDAILAAARRVFARNGLAATRTSDIAAEARISQGLLYHYFPTKENLFTEIVEAAMRETVVLTTRAAQAPGQAWPRLEQPAAANPGVGRRPVGRHRPDDPTARFSRACLAALAGPGHL